MKIAELLEQEMKKSAHFPEDNFGLRMGKDWPKFVQEVMADDMARQAVVLNYMDAVTSVEKLKKDIEPIVEKLLEAKTGDESPEVAIPLAMDDMAKKSFVYEPSLRFLYWGIEIGKQLASTEALEKMFNAEVSEHGTN